MVSALGAGEWRDGHTCSYAKASYKRLELDMMWMQMDRSVVGCKLDSVNGGLCIPSGRVANDVVIFLSIGRWCIVFTT